MLLEGLHLMGLWWAGLLLVRYLRKNLAVENVNPQVLLSSSLLSIGTLTRNDQMALQQPKLR
jgi:hypothetical protein